MVKNKFPIFDRNKNNMIDGGLDEDNIYLSDGFDHHTIADSSFHNTLFNNLSTMTHHIGELMKSKDIDATVDDIELYKKIEDTIRKIVCETLTPQLTGGGGYNNNNLNIKGSNISNIGYTCLGIPYNDLIIQYGLVSGNTGETTIQFPIAFTTYALSVVCTDAGSACYSDGIQLEGLTYFKLWAKEVSTNQFVSNVTTFIAIGV